jgi:cellulose synthase/poly-beta-1,6-N-acetylglucosamine synthase-like glycosyltransferase
VTVALLLAGAAVLLGLVSYVLYPLLLPRLAERTAPRHPADAGPLSVEVLLSAADEEQVIGDRVRDLLAQDVGGSYRVTVGCDGCGDATAPRAREAADERVSVVEVPLRRGKAAVLNDLVAASRADVIVFTDANTRFEPDAVRRLVEPFADPLVGAACGRLVLDAGSGAPETPETSFWRLETRLKEAEGRLGVCLGANGAIYAARRDRIEPLPLDTSMDDFLIPVRIARQGMRVVFAGKAVAREEVSREVWTELSRRYRIGIGAGQVLRREAWLLDFHRHPMLTLAFTARKAARWLAPVLCLVAILAALGSRDLRPYASLLLVTVTLLLLAAWLDLRLAGWPGKLQYFAVINVALAAGVVAGLLGLSRPTWNRTPR